MWLDAPRGQPGWRRSPQYCDLLEACGGARPSWLRSISYPRSRRRAAWTRPEKVAAVERSVTMTAGRRSAAGGDGRRSASRSAMLSLKLRGDDGGTTIAAARLSSRRHPEVVMPTSRRAPGCSLSTSSVSRSPPRPAMCGPARGSRTRSIPHSDPHSTPSDPGPAWQAERFRTLVAANSGTSTSRLPSPSHDDRLRRATSMGEESITVPPAAKAAVAPRAVVQKLTVLADVEGHPRDHADPRATSSAMAGMWRARIGRTPAAIGPGIRAAALVPAKPSSTIRRLKYRVVPCIYLCPRGLLLAPSWRPSPASSKVTVEPFCVIGQDSALGTNSGSDAVQDLASLPIEYAISRVYSCTGRWKIPTGGSSADRSIKPLEGRRATLLPPRLCEVLSYQRWVSQRSAEGAEVNMSHLRCCAVGTDNLAGPLEVCVGVVSISIEITAISEAD